MRRLALTLAGLAAASCAGPERLPAGVPPPAAPAVVVPKGFEARPDEQLTEYDLTHDGKPDVWKYSLKDDAGKETLLRKQKDLNGDGRLDSWEKFAPDGTLSVAVYDLDFDGKPDETAFYERDQLVRKELALGFDGVPRTWNYYEKGKLVRKERDTNGDASVDTWEYWENGEVDRIGVDLDADGQVDRWEARKSAQAEGKDEKAAPGEKPAAPPAPQK